MKMWDEEFTRRVTEFVATMPDWAKGSPINSREPIRPPSCEIECPKCNGRGRIKVEITKSVQRG